MLVLTRRVGEAIVLGNDEVRVTVLGVKGNQVRIGIVAPPKIEVHREEVYERIKTERNNKGGVLFPAASGSAGVASGC